jgi:glycerol-1-phosphate dehydrogenase [NAD(P)+]
MPVPKIFRIEEEENLYEKFGNILEQLNLGNTYIVVRGTGYTSKVTNGFVDNIKKYKLLDPTDLRIEKPTFTAAAKVRVHALNKNAPIIGIGGGKIMDVAKLGGNDAKKPVILVSTQPTNDGLSSNVVSLNQYGKPYSLPVNAPLAVVLPMRYHYKSSPETVIRGVGDSFAKITANLDWELSSRFDFEKNQKDPPYNKTISSLCKEATKKIIKKTREMRDEGPFTLKHPDYKSYVSSLVDALVSYGVSMCTLESSVCSSGDEHLYGHGLDSRASNPPAHGIGVGGIGSIIGLKLHEEYNKKPPISYEELKKLEDYLGLPYRLRSLQLKKSEAISSFIEAIKIGDERGRITIFDYLKEKRNIKLDEGFAEKIPYETRII